MKTRWEMSDSEYENCRKITPQPGDVFGDSMIAGIGITVVLALGLYVVQSYGYLNCKEETQVTTPITQTIESKLESNTDNQNGIEIKTEK